MTWTTVSGADSYVLEESINGGAWTQVQISNFYGKDTGTYSYRAKACNAIGCGPVSAAATTTVTLFLPLIPALTMSQYWDQTGVTITWTAVVSTSYKLEDSTDGGATWTQIYAGPSASFWLMQPNLTTYQYRVRACNSNGCSAYSEVGFVTVEKDPCPTCFVTPPPDETSSLTPKSILDGAIAKADVDRSRELQSLGQREIAR